MLKGKSKKEEVRTIMNPDVLCKAVKKNPSKYSLQLRRACMGIKVKDEKKKTKKKKKVVKKNDK
jgi:hypothetical protein